MNNDNYDINDIYELVFKLYDPFMTDKQWLIARVPDASDSELEYFLERVAIYIHDAHMDEMDARQLAYINLTGHVLA